jgi:hypothetical protein
MRPTKLLRRDRGWWLRSASGGRHVSGYQINVFYSEQDGGYIANILDSVDLGAHY